MSFLALMAVLSLTAQTARPEALPYEDTLRCAGLTQAASELEGAENLDGRKAFDAALYWALTAGQAAQAAGKSDAAADADQTRARIAAVAQLNAGNADARADLDRCRARTPNLG